MLEGHFKQQNQQKPHTKKCEEYSIKQTRKRILVYSAIDETKDGRFVLLQLGMCAGGNSNFLPLSACPQKNREIIVSSGSGFTYKF